MDRARLCVVVQRLASALMLSTAPFVAIERASADCTPTTSAANPVTNTTVTCSGATTNQNTVGIQIFGYGTGNETGVTINVQSGASVTSDGGTSNASAGIFVSDGIVNNLGTVTRSSAHGDGISGLFDLTVNNSGNINVDGSGQHGDNGVLSNAGNVNVTNFFTGTIFGSNTGVSGAAVNVINTGRIESDGFPGFGTAVRAFGDATVTNNVDGTSIGKILGNIFGINADGGRDSLANATVTNGSIANGVVTLGGVISATSGPAIHANGTATVSNIGDGTTTGIISGSSRGIDAGTVNVLANTGRIEATALNGSAINASNEATVNNAGTIAADADVGTAISANTVNVATNTGTIRANGAEGIAINAAVANITSGGVIQATGTDSIAINALNTATVSNIGDGTNTGIISGSIRGIDAGTVIVSANTGRIEATATSGIAISAGGAVDVSSSGQILAPLGTVIFSSNGPITVKNSATGTIIGANGINANASTVQVDNAGLIKATDGPILGPTVTVNNSGTVQATGTGSIAILASDFLGGGATVTNTGDGITTGIISADRIAVGSNGSADVDNSGKIQAIGAGGLASTAIFAGGSITVKNSATGVITGPNAAIDSSGSINVTANAGLIEATAPNGVAIEGPLTTLNGVTVNNSGTIQANADNGFAIRGTTVNVNANTGTIQATGTDGVAISAVVTATVNNSNGGIISGSALGIDADDATVTNGGVIGSGNGTAINATGTATVSNTGDGIHTGIISGSTTGIGAGTVNVTANTGRIEATAANGVAINAINDATVNNAGTIAADAGFGFAISARTVNVTANTGTISAGGAGGVAIDGGTANVTSSGKISADGASGTAIFVENLNVTNGGLISAKSGDAIRAVTTATVSNLSGGAILGGVFGITASTLDVTNAFGATISGGDTGVQGSGIVRNAGTITGGTASVSFNGAGPNTLILQTGSVLNGDAVGSTSAGATNNLILQGSGNASNNFVNFNTLDVQADGTWVWGSSANGNFGATTVSSGTFAVDGLLFSPVTVNAGGTLAGHGTIHGEVSAANGGTIAPGAAVPFSTLTVQGNVNFASGSIYRVNINAAGQNDKLLLNGGGMATLGGTVNVVSQGGFVLSTPYTILTATGGLNGTTFGGVSGLTSAFLTPSLSYDPNDVFLTLTAGNGSGSGFGFAGAAQTRNERAVAAALDAGPTTSALILAVLSQTFDGARRAFDALSGEVFGSLHNAQTGEAQFARSAMLGRLRQASYAGTSGELGALGFAGPQLAYASSDANGLSAKAGERSRDLTFWAQGLGGWGHTDSDGNAASVSSRFGGFLSGVDARFGDMWRAGLVAGFVRSDLSVAARSSSAGIDSVQLGGYAGGRIGAFNLRGGASVSIDSIDTSRAIFFPGFTDKASARVHGNVGQVFGEVGYGIAFDRIAVEPLAGLAYVHLHDAAFRESGGIAALSGASANENIGYAYLGARAATAVPLANGTVLVPRATLQWQHAFGDVTPVTALAFRGTGTGFSVAGIPIARDTALVEGGVDWRFAPQAKLGAFYQGELAAHAQTHALKGAFTWDF